MEERELREGTDREILLDRPRRHPRGAPHEAGRYMSLELQDVWAGGVTLGQQRIKAMNVHEIIVDSSA